MAIVYILITIVTNTLIFQPWAYIDLYIHLSTLGIYIVTTTGAALADWAHLLHQATESKEFSPPREESYTRESNTRESLHSAMVVFLNIGKTPSPNLMEDHMTKDREIRFLSRKFLFRGFLSSRAMS